MKYLVKNKFWKINEDYNKEKLLYLLIDRPTVITRHGLYLWKNNENLYHREYDLPSYVWNNWDIWWFKNGERHRENNKPAIIENSGYKECRINGKFIFS